MFDMTQRANGNTYDFLGGSCHLSFFWDTAELVVDSNRKTKASNKKKNPVLQTPHWYLPVGCEVDMAKEMEAKRKDAAKATDASSSSSTK